MGRLPHRPDGRLKDEDLEAINNAMLLCELDSLRHRQFNSLSAGEAARVNIARLFTTRPQLILADEPVASLDPGHQLMLMSTLLEQSRSQGTTTILVLHDLALASRWCDQLVLLHQGAVVAKGEPARVITRENLQAWYGVEAELLAGRYATIPDYLQRTLGALK
jgi:iron complex transport system ATP-binding protein